MASVTDLEANAVLKGYIFVTITMARFDGTVLVRVNLENKHGISAVQKSLIYPLFSTTVPTL